MPIHMVDPVQRQDELFERLRLRASWLSYPGFALLSVRLLRSLGYEHVRPVGRRSFKGPSAEGGIDMRATNRVGQEVVIQLKRCRANRNISCQAVDTLRGVMCRDRAPMGLMVSTTSFSREAHRSAQLCTDWPIMLISGSKLGRLLAVNGLGVAMQKHPVTGSPRLVFDEGYFDLLDRFARTHKEIFQPVTSRDVE